MIFKDIDPVLDAGLDLMALDEKAAALREHYLRLKEEGKLKDSDH